MVTIQPTNSLIDYDNNILASPLGAQENTAETLWSSSMGQDNADDKETRTVSQASIKTEYDKVKASVDALIAAQENLATEHKSNVDNIIAIHMNQVKSDNPGQNKEIAASMRFSIQELSGKIGPIASGFIDRMVSQIYEIGGLQKDIDAIKELSDENSVFNPVSAASDQQDNTLPAVDNPFSFITLAENIDAGFVEQMATNIDKLDKDQGGTLAGFNEMLDSVSDTNLFAKQNIENIDQEAFSDEDKEPLLRTV
ncbi:hypothetical protein tpqmel_0342 [Candidatus Gastranaerophilus sp. (ex Termes propinquus)]|nr:hypothetical protein tpqmel_0342 [Candidatus Gastranaerophilus sp. (ex Termes propinquus)]